MTLHARQRLILRQHYLEDFHFCSVIPIKKSIAKNLNWTSAEITTKVDPEDFVNLVKEINNEDCTMKWKYLELPQNTKALDIVKEYEWSVRPSVMLGLYGIKGASQRELAAVGTVAEKLSWSFDHLGFPVIARCFVTKKFRNQGVYSLFLSQRVNLCDQLFGDGLKAIHLGSNNTTVVAALKSKVFNGRKFLPVGTETIGKSDNLQTVTDYLCFTQSYIKMLTHIPWKGQHPKSVELLRSMIDELVSKGLDETGYARLLDTLNWVENETGWNPCRFNQSLRQLLDFLKSVPVTEIRY